MLRTLEMMADVPTNARKHVTQNIAIALTSNTQKDLVF